MKCPVCKGKRKIRNKTERWVKISKPTPCPNKNCINGTHMVPRDPKIDQVGFGSSFLIHGMEGKALCSKCRGKKCEHCDFTGMFGVPCKRCGASGWVYKTQWHCLGNSTDKPKPCPYCQDGDYDSYGNMADIMAEAITNAIDQAEKEAKEPVQNKS